MAFTVLTSPAASTFQSVMGSIGMETVNVTSTINLNGSNLYVRVGLFHPTTDPLTVPTAAPDEGFQIAYNSTPGSYDLTLIPGTNSQYNALNRVRITVTDGFTFNIIISGLMAMDVNGMLEQRELDTNLDRPLKNNIDNSVQLNNDYPSVYIQQRRLRVEVWTDASTGFGAQYSKLINARWWNKGLADGTPEFTQFYYRLSRGGTIVNNFSPFQDTKVRFYLTHTPGAPNNTYGVGIFRVDDVNNNAIYGTDLELNYGFNPGPSAFPNLPTSAIAATNNPAATSNPNQYVYEVDFDKDYFTPGGQYRAFLVAQEASNTYFNSFITGPLNADQPTDATVGTFTTNIITYDFNDTVAVTDCATGLTPRERVLVRVQIDKDSYNADVKNNGSFGNFDYNLRAVNAFFLDSLPTDGQQLEVTDRSRTLRFNSFDSGTGAGAYHQLESIFRIPDDWAGTTKYLVFAWIFDLGQGTPYAYTDEIYKIVQITVRGFDTTLLTGITIEDDAMATLDPDRICASYVGNLNFQIATSAGVPADYSFFPLIIKNVPNIGINGWREEDGYLNSVLEPRLDAELITSTGTDLASPTFVVPASELDIEQEYCVTVVAKKKVTGSLAGCPSFNFTLTQTTESVNDEPAYDIHEIVVDFDFVIAGGGLTANDIMLVQITVSEAQPYGDEVFTYSETLTGGNEIIYDGYGEAEITYEVNVTLVTGCTYSATRTLTTNETPTDTSNVVIAF